MYFTTDESIEDEEDTEDIDFSEPETDPTVTYCDICGAPIEATEPVDIPENHNPNNYLKQNICDDCRRREQEYLDAHAASDPRNWRELEDYFGW